MTENAWLIEKADSEHEGCVVPGEALGVYDGEAPFLNRKRALWGPYNRALRFARQKDAEAAASVLVPCADTIVVCHSWSDLPTEANAPLQVLERSDNNLQAEVHQ